MEKGYKGVGAIIEFSNLSSIMYTYMYNVYHKGVIAPLYIGIVVVGQYRSHTFGKSAFPWQ